MTEDDPQNQLQQINIRLYQEDIEDAKKLAEEDYSNYSKYLREATHLGMQQIKKKRGRGVR